LERIFGGLGFGAEIQRRGGRVSPLEIGSRADVLFFGGILGFYAELRRECFFWGLRFCVFGGCGREITWINEEGGPIVRGLGEF
jgi:hypothetical protein